MLWYSGEEKEGVEWVVRERVRGEMTQALYAHMNNKRKKMLWYKILVFFQG
jgi:hypothetical protein